MSASCLDFTVYDDDDDDDNDVNECYKDDKDILNMMMMIRSSG